MKKKPAHKRYNGGIIRPTPYGTFRAEFNLAHRRYRCTHKTEAQARAWIDNIRHDADQHIEPSPEWDVRDALRAQSLLPPGVTLTDAARFYLQHTQKLERVTLREAAELFLKDKTAAGLRRRSLENLRHRINPLIADYGDKPIVEIDGNILLTWLDTHHVTGGTRGNYRRGWSNLFRWCKRARYLRDLPTDAISSPRSDEKLPDIFPVATVANLFEQARQHAPELIPYLALGFFAGIRPAELDRLTTSAIGPGLITITAAASKVRQQRHVTIQPTLRAWLDTYPPAQFVRRAISDPAPGIHAERPDAFRIAPRRVYDKLKALRILAGGISWPADVMRHCFATYHLALFTDAALTAHELGHRSTTMLYRHYRNLATPDDAAAYWNILPPGYAPIHACEMSSSVSSSNPVPRRSTKKPEK